MKLVSCIWLLASCAALASTEEQINKNLSASPGGTLVIDVDFGSIDVCTNASDTVKIDVWRKITRKTKTEEEDFLRQQPVQILQEGSTVTIRCKRKERASWWNQMGSRNEAKYTVAVPSRCNAQLATAGGPIAVSDLSGELKAHTSGGGLRFARVRGPINGGTSGGGIHVTDCEGVVKIHTSGGGIDVTGGNGSLDGGTSGGGVKVKDFKGPTHVATSGGGITIENATGQVNGSTSGGSVHASLVGPVTGDVSLSSSGGGVTLSVPEQAAFNLDASCSGGSVRCDLPITVQGKRESHHLKGPVNGGGPNVRLSTSGGGVHVRAR